MFILNLICVSILKEGFYKDSNWQSAYQSGNWYYLEALSKQINNEA